MKFILVASLIIFLSACNSSGTVSTYTKPASSSAEQQRVKTSQLEQNKYRLRYNALLKESLQDAQENWMKNASKICNDNDFTYKITKQGFVSDFNEKPGKVLGDLSGLCVTGGAVGCIIASIFGSESSSSSAAVGSPFAAVEGLVTCSTEQI